VGRGRRAGMEGQVRKRVLGNIERTYAQVA
jgi:hypothetical protein